jgi:hypothetical protein
VINNEEHKTRRTSKCVNSFTEMMYALYNFVSISLFLSNFTCSNLTKTPPNESEIFLGTFSLQSISVPLDRDVDSFLLGILALPCRTNYGVGLRNSVST